MKFHSSGRSLANWLLALASSLLVAACGGGGAATSTGNNQGGAPLFQPDGGTLYAGVVYPISITGGRRPFALSSSEPSLMPVPATLDGGSFDVLAANPGVIDANLPPGSLPVRTVNITARDANGLVATASFKVGVNFLTGYGVSFSSNCPAPSSGAAPSACAGGDTLVTLFAVTNGNIYGGKQFRFEVVRGPFAFVDVVTGQAGPSVTVTTDHSGNAVALARVTAGVPTQLALMRVVDVATGVYTYEIMPISQNGPSSILTALPNSFTFTGALTTQCGTGSGDFLVFDGQPPYTSFSSDPNLRVTPASTDVTPGHFTVTAFNSQVCLDNATVVITDSRGSRTTVTVTTRAGSTAPPAPVAMAVQPTSITLSCGTAGSVSVVGGTGSYFVNSTHPRVTAVVSGNTVTITRLTGDAAGSSFPTSGGISISDGQSISTVTLTVPANCP